jgi:hypothetical protein
LEHEIDEILSLLEKLEPLEKADLLIKLLPYILPKVSSVNFKEGQSLWDNFI